jgi:hypothetical protein
MIYRNMYQQKRGNDAKTKKISDATGYISILWISSKVGVEVGVTNGRGASVLGMVLDADTGGVCTGFLRGWDCGLVTFTGVSIGLLNTLTLKK